MFECLYCLPLSHTLLFEYPKPLLTLAYPCFLLCRLESLEITLSFCTILHSCNHWSVVKALGFGLYVGCEKYLLFCTFPFKKVVKSISPPVISLNCFKICVIVFQPSKEPHVLKISSLWRWPFQSQRVHYKWLYYAFNFKAFITCHYVSSSCIIWLILSCILGFHTILLTKLFLKLSTSKCCATLYYSILNL